MTLRRKSGFGIEEELEGGFDQSSFYPCIDIRWSITRKLFKVFLLIIWYFIHSHNIFWSYPSPRSPPLFMHNILHLPSNFLSLFSNALTLTRAVHMCMSEEPCTGTCGTYHVSHSKERWIFPFPGSHQLSIAPQLQTGGVSLLIYPGKFIVWLDFVWVIRRQPVSVSLWVQRFCQVQKQWETKHFGFIVTGCVGLV